MKIISEERCFKGAGYNKIHETLDNKKTLCGITIYMGIFWIRGTDSDKVDCKRCLKKLEAKNDN